MKKNLFKLGMGALACGLLVACGGGNNSSVPAESKGSADASAPDSAHVIEASSEAIHEASSVEVDPDLSVPEIDESEPELSAPEIDESEPEIDQSEGEPIVVSEQGDNSEEVAETKYGLVGSFAGGSWVNDIFLTKVEGEEGVYSVEHRFEIGDVWKIRVNSAWATSYGYSNLYFKPESEFASCFQAGDSNNVSVLKSGNYVVYFTENPEGITVDGEIDAEQSEPEHTWGLIGSMDNWTSDIPFVKDEMALGEWTLQYTFQPWTKFKVRADAKWDIQFGYSDCEFFGGADDCFSGEDGGNIVFSNESPEMCRLIVRYYGAGEAGNGLSIELL